MKNGWEAVIGLEIHVRLDTHSKLFSGARAAYGADANTQVSFLDAGLPGTLPVLNAQAVRSAIRFGLAIDAEISRETVFARKNYFYPDLPKGYQISQMDRPIVSGGHVTIQPQDGEPRRINITRAHLEEDAGKSIHDAYAQFTAIDLNRAGTPLIEVVSEPEMHSAAEAVAYMREIYALVTHLGICDGNLQEGSFRCDANVSVRPSGHKALGTRTEIKNLNSFRFIEKAINHEIKRQIRMIEGGGTVIQETRLYDAEADSTRAMRSKEEANDYRYFPDPDLLPVRIEAADIEAQRALLPEFPAAKQARYMAQLGLREQEARIVAHDVPLARYFEAVVAATEATPDAVVKWLLGDFSALLNAHDVRIEEAPVDPARQAGLLDQVQRGAISMKIARQVLERMWDTSEDAAQIIEREGLAQISDAGALAQLVDQVLQDNPDQVAGFRAGNDKLFNFFVGQVMKRTQGKANPVQLKELLQEKLNT